MRRCLFLFPLLFLPFFASGTEIIRIWPGHRTAESFERVGEYFGGRESTGNREILARSQPNSREGYYFLVRLRSPAAHPAAMLVVEVIKPGSDTVSTHFLPADLPRGSQAFLAGLTGSDWPSNEIHPTAWQIRVLAPDGTELTRQASHLWSLPSES